MKQVNENGFWRIENNPISQVGVFPYLGKNISDKLEPNKIYFVYRPAEELFAPETLDSFNSTPLPLVDEHEMLGDGATPAENKGIHGVISNVRQDGKLLVGDISIYSETMKDEINRGKKDLSMGYYCEYDLEEGDYEGQHYDAVQRNLRGNHVALVDQGRCGHSVRVYDHFALDADFKEEDHPRDEDGKFTKKGQGISKVSKNSNLEKVQNSIKNIPEKVKQKVITQYTGGHYYEMNEYLRGYAPKDKSMFKTPQERKEAVQTLTKLTLQPMKETILTRLSSVDDLDGLVSDEVLEKIQQRNYRDISAIQNELVGKTFENKGFTSTSDGNLATASWLKNKPIKFILHAPDGTLGVDVSNESIQSKLNSEFDLTKEENEVILAPGTKFKITGVNSPKEDSLWEWENKQFFMTEYEKEKFREQDFNPYDAPLIVHAEVISPEINDDYMKKVEEEYSEETEPTKTRDKKKRIVHSVAKNFNDKYKEVFLKVYNVIKNLGSNEELASKNLSSNEELTSVFNEIRAKDIPALSKEVDNLEKTGEHLVAQKKLTKLLFNLPASSSNGTYNEESLDKFKLFFIEKTQRPQFSNIDDAKKELFSLMDIMEHFTNEVAERKVSEKKAGFYQSYMQALKNDIETRLDLLNPKDAQEIRYLTNDLKTMHPLAAAQEYITRESDFWERSFLESRERFLTNKNKNIEKIKSLGSANSVQDAAEFKEEDHPRDEDDKFAKKGQGSATKTKSDTEKEIKTVQPSNELQNHQTSNSGLQNNQTSNRLQTAKTNALKQLNFNKENPGYRRVNNDVMQTFILTQKPSEAEEDAATDYTSNYGFGCYSSINKYLRTGEVDNSLKEKVENNVENLTKLTESGVTQYDVSLFRGTTLQEFSSILSPQDIEKFNFKNLQKKLIGQKFKTKAFVSTTDAPDNPFVANPPVSMHIIAPAGTQGIDIAKYSKFPEECEILLKRDTLFEITDIQKTSRKHLIVEVTIIPDREIKPKPIQGNLSKKFQEIKEQHKLDSDEVIQPIKNLFQKHPEGAEALAETLATAIYNEVVNPEANEPLISRIVDRFEETLTEEEWTTFDSMRDTIAKIAKSKPFDDLSIENLKQIENEVRENPTSWAARNKYEYIVEQINDYAQKGYYSTNEIINKLENMFDKDHGGLKDKIQQLVEHQARIDAMRKEREELGLIKKKKPKIMPVSQWF